MTEVRGGDWARSGLESDERSQGSRLEGVEKTESEVLEPADLVIVCPHMGDGGLQRVVAILANAWHAKDVRICVVTLFEDDSFYRLDSGIQYVKVLERYGTNPGGIFEKIRSAVICSQAVLKDLLRLMFVAVQYVFAVVVWPIAVIAKKLLDSNLIPKVVLHRGRVIQNVMRTTSGKLKTCLSNGVAFISPAYLFELSVRVFPKRWTLPLLWLHQPTYFRSKYLKRVIRETGTSRVLSFCGSSNVIAILACQQLPVQVTVSERNDPSRQRLTTPWEGLRRAWYGQADIVTANTREALITMRDYVDSDKLAYVPNPVIVGKLEPRVLSFKTPSRRILIVARLHYQKAHDVLIRAFQKFLREYSNWRLAIVGRGERERELKSLAVSCGVSDNIEWYGQVENPNDFYRAADIFVLPSRYEGMSNALAEAMSHRLPPVVSDASPGSLDLVEHETTGLVVGVEDSDALCAALMRLAGNPELRQSLGHAAGERVSQYDVPSTLSRWERLFQAHA